MLQLRLELLQLYLQIGHLSSRSLCIRYRQIDRQMPIPCAALSESAAAVLIISSAASAMHTGNTKCEHEHEHANDSWRAECWASIAAERWCMQQDGLFEASHWA